ncbi:hypothetical protein LZG75_12070 [Polynucleobacter sp. IMCC30063]|uniref:hypothetical protein n=1 Tax=Polynucleobacter sp. IMCC30063 TaxID=2907298 RepID=UPI001F3BB770|nr:hypothetical protein [Polynucleobacter sp. IMCC30063]MCE7506965.1 hypothetical protein [Polynucleobacter sp. IMCC30063]
MTKIIELLSEDNGKPNYWDCLFSRFIQKSIKAPKLVIKRNKEVGGAILPVMVIESDYVSAKGESILIDNQTLESIGAEIEKEFGIEFLESSRTQVISSH